MTQFHLFRNGSEELPYILVRLYKGAHGTRAAISKSDGLPSEGYSWPDPGCDAEAALAWAANYAGINAINVYIQLDHVEWDPSWGKMSD